jgi:hypothetical protein
MSDSKGAAGFIEWIRIAGNTISFIVI